MELRRAEEHNSFFMGDKVIKDIRELLEALKDPVNKEAVKAHVADDKNDFANWIRDVLHDEDLAGKIDGKKDTGEIISILQEKVDMQKPSIAGPSDPYQPGQDSTPIGQSGSLPISSPEQSDIIGAEKKLDDINASLPESLGALSSKPEKSAELGAAGPENAMGQANIGTNQTTAETTTQATGENPQIGNDAASPLAQPPKEEGAGNEEAKEGSMEGPKAISESTGDQKPEGAHVQTSTPGHDEILKKAINPRHWCPWFFDCTKKEFLFGAGVGFVLGVVITIIFRIVL